MAATLALVAAVTAVAVAATSFLVVRQVRLSSSTDDAIEQSRFNLALAADRLPAEATGGEIEALLRALQRRGGFDIVVVSNGRTFQTSVSLGPAVVPEDLEELVRQGRITAARRDVAGRSHVVVGGQLAGGHVLWFFYPLDDVFDDLRDLGWVLAVSAAVMVLLSGAVGVLSSRALLRPIAQARDAARKLEAGDLGTRLPDEGSDEFAELSHSFNAMAAALERTVADLRDAEAGHRRFVADVSHELRTPVTALATAADVLEPRIPDMADEHRRAARLLVDESKRLRTLVEDLMEISRLDAGRAVMEFHVVDLRRLVFACVTDQRWEEHVRVGELQPAVVTGDRRRLERVLANLVDNALRHGAPPVDIALRTADAHVVLEVSDHGDGIADEHLPHVFERFFKADPARRRSSSSGLGLAIAKENVALHGGSISVSNVAGAGARMTVTLPRAADAPAGEVSVEAAVVDVGSAEGGWR